MNAVHVFQFLVIFLSDVQYFTAAQICDIPIANEVKAVYEMMTFTSLPLTAGTITDCMHVP